MKKVEAYQTSDGEKFFKKEAAESHEKRLIYKSKAEEIETYLYNLLGIKAQDPLDGGDGPEEQLYDILENECTSHIWADCGIEGIIELILDMATIADGALLKTAQYAKKITASNKEGK